MNNLLPTRSYKRLPLLCSLFYILLSLQATAQISPFLIRADNNGWFGKVPCFDKKNLTITLINTSTASVSISAVRFPNSDFLVDTASVIGFVRSSTQQFYSVRRFPLSINSNDTLTILVTYFPLRQGLQTAPMEINYSRNQQTPERMTVANAVSGYGLSIKVYSAPLTNGRDWVTQIGSFGVRTVVLRTLIGDRTQIQSVALEQSGNEFALTNSIPLPSPLTALIGETFVCIPIRYTPLLSVSGSNAVNSSYSSSATLRIIVQYQTNLDTLRQELRAVGENPAVSRRVIRPGLRPQRDSIPSGDSAVIELFLNQPNISSLAPALLTVASDSMRSLIAVNKNLIASPPQQWFNNQWSARELATERSSVWRIFELSGDGKNASAWSGNTDILMRMRSQAMIGDTDQAPLILLDFQWLTKDPFSYIVQQPSLPASMTVRTCTAGGKRLFTQASTATLALQNTFPNPASTHVDIAYSSHHQSRKP
ncbi:MAG: hypothetical protein MUF71_01135 [Candidatus Kapabacteria bacterium]|nr:hypothetical protein [Candidatus Kapabacteria bacterium]